MNHVDPKEIEHIMHELFKPKKPVQTLKYKKESMLQRLKEVYNG